MFVDLKYLSSTELPKEIDYFIQCTNCSLQADRKDGKGKTNICSSTFEKDLG
jgi:hypothetical protein